MASISTGALPEERELAAKREALSALEEELAKAELDLATLQAELNSVEREYLPKYFPLPHPSFHNIRWQQINPWFRDEVIPALREELKRALK